MLILTKKHWAISFKVGLLAGVNLLFLFLQIHKQSQFVKLTYAKQRLERELDQLTKRQNDLEYQLHLQQNHKDIKRYALKKLGMRPTSLKQIHRLSQLVDLDSHAAQQ